jgi:BolA protein
MCGSRRQHKRVRLRAGHADSAGAVDREETRNHVGSCVVTETIEEAMRIAQIIEAKLTQALRPTTLQVIDESARHAGHAGAPEGGESHFRLEIVSAEFAGKSRVERQRLVYALLAAELGGPVHALSLVTRTPEEAAR